MVCVGGVLLSGTPHHRLVVYAMSVLFILGGGLMFIRRPFVFYVALLVAAGTVLMGIWGLWTHQELGLPVPSWGFVVMGLYFAFRALIAKASLEPKKKLSPPPAP